MCPALLSTLLLEHFFRGCPNDHDVLPINPEWIICQRRDQVRRPAREPTSFVYIHPRPMELRSMPRRGLGAERHARGLLGRLPQQHKTTLGVPKPLRIYLQVGTRMLYHYLEVNSKRLGGRCRMGLGAVNAAPCVHGRRSARGAVNKRPQAAARANHRRRSAPLRAPHRVGAIHYATRSAPAPRTQEAASSAGGTIYTPATSRRAKTYGLSRSCRYRNAAASALGRRTSKSTPQRAARAHS